ncbi:hypothetical protein WJX77_006086 [Trebouxia sp. C0004]
MPSSEATRTPATSRKRARCQPSAATSLSLLAVPKLKSCDSVPADIQTASATGRGSVKGRSKLKAAQPVQAPSKQACKAVTARTSGDKENQSVHLNQAAGPHAKQTMPQQSSVQLEQQANMGTQPQLLAKVSSASVVIAMDRVIRVSQQAAVSFLASGTIKSESAAVVPQNVCASSSPESQHVDSEVHPDLVKQPNLAMLAPSPSFHAKDEEEHHVTDVPLACQTAINNRRRPVGQAVRYGEWYTGNDTDLDEHLLEYNAEQASAAFAGLERRKSALPSYTADLDDSDFTDEDRELAGKRTSRLRRSTIAPGQDTAAQVAAMTAKLSRLAEDMLPQEEEEVCDKRARRLKQKGQDSKDLRQRLLDSWDGKSYYERLQADAEGHQGCYASGLDQAAMVLDKPGIAHAHARPALGVAGKASQDGKTPRPSKNRLTSAVSPSRQPAVMSPKLLVSAEAKLQSRTQRQAAQKLPLQTQQQDKDDTVEGNMSADPHPTTAPKTKRLPPLPPTVRPSQHSQQEGKAQQHGISSGTGNVRGGHQPLHHHQPQLRQHQQDNGEGPSKSASKTEATGAQPHGKNLPVKGKPGTAKADDHSITAAKVESTVSRVTSGSALHNSAAAEGHAEETGHSQPVQSKISTGRVKSGPPDHQAATGSSQQRQIARKGRGKADTSVGSWAQHAVAMQPGRAKPNVSKMSRTVVASDNSNSSEASDEAAEAAPSETSKPAATSQSFSGDGAKQHEVKGQAPDEVPAGGEARSADGDCSRHNKGQQQVAQLTASNTALLSELVELQGDKTVLKEQMRHEHEARKAADAESANLTRQLQQEKIARAAAEQQVSQLQIAMQEMQQQIATMRRTGVAQQQQTSAAAVSVQSRLQSVKLHAAALAEAAEALAAVSQ